MSAIYPNFTNTKKPHHTQPRKHSYAKHMLGWVRFRRRREQLRHPQQSVVVSVATSAHVAKVLHQQRPLTHFAVEFFTLATVMQCGFLHHQNTHRIHNPHTHCRTAHTRPEIASTFFRSHTSLGAACSVPSSPHQPPTQSKHSRTHMLVGVYVCVYSDRQNPVHATDNGFRYSATTTATIRMPKTRRDTQHDRASENTTNETRNQSIQASRSNCWQRAPHTFVERARNQRRA